MSLAQRKQSFCANPACDRIPAPHNSLCFGCLRTYKAKLLTHHQRTAKMYAVEGADLVKVGITAGEMSRRMVALQTGSPVRLKLLGYVAAPPTMEPALHRALITCRSHGEWFRKEPKLLEAVQLIVSDDIDGLAKFLGWT